MLLTDVIDELDILADQLEQEAKKTTVYEVELAPEIRPVTCLSSLQSEPSS